MKEVLEIMPVVQLVQVEHRIVLDNTEYLLAQLIHFIFLLNKSELVQACTSDRKTVLLSYYNSELVLGVL